MADCAAEYRLAFPIFLLSMLLSSFAPLYEYQRCKVETQMYYCKFGNVCEGFIFAKYAKFREKKTLRNGEITPSFIDKGKSCPSSEFYRRKYVF